MRRLVAQHEGEFILIAGIRDQRQGEGNYRAALLVEGLESVGRLPRAVVHDDVEIAVHALGPVPALALCHRLDGLNHPHETAGRLVWRQCGTTGRGRRLGRAGRGPHGGHLAGRQGENRQHSTEGLSDHRLFLLPRFP